MCHSKSGEVNSSKVANLVKAYVDKYKHARKKWARRRHRCGAALTDPFSCSSAISSRWNSASKQKTDKQKQNKKKMTERLPFLFVFSSLSFLFLISLPFIEWWKKKNKFSIDFHILLEKKKKDLPDQKIVMQEPFILHRSVGETTVKERRVASGFGGREGY